MKSQLGVNNKSRKIMRIRAPQYENINMQTEREIMVAQVKVEQIKAMKLKSRSKFTITIRAARLSQYY